MKPLLSLIAAAALTLPLAPGAAQTAPATSAAPAPALSLEQQMTLRCAAAFAVVSYGQGNGNADALRYPDLGVTGREYFVRALARLMDDTGMTREQVAQQVRAEAQRLWDDKAIDTIMPSCLSAMELSGIE